MVDTVVDDDMELDDLLAVETTVVVCESPSTLDDENVDDGTDFEVLTVVLSIRVLGEVICVLDDGVVEAGNDDEPLFEFWTVVESICALCEGPCTLKDTVFDWKADDEVAFENLLDLVEVDVDVILEVDKVVERGDTTDENVALDEVSVFGVVTFELDDVADMSVEDECSVEDIEDVVCIVDGVFPELFEVDEDRVDDTSSIEDVKEVTGVDELPVWELFEVVIGILDDDSVLEKMEDRLGVGDDVL